MIELSLLSSVSKHNMWSYYDWVVVVVRQWTQYVVVLWLGCRCCLPSVNTICGRIIIVLSLLSSVSTQYVVVLWLGCRCLPSASTICGLIMIGLSLLPSVSKHTMWSYYDWIYCCCRPSVNTICGRIIIRCHCCRLSVNTICGRIMIGFIVVVVRQ